MLLFGVDSAAAKLKNLYIHPLHNKMHMQRSAGIFSAVLILLVFASAAFAEDAPASTATSNTAAGTSSTTTTDSGTTGGASSATSSTETTTTATTQQTPIPVKEPIAVQPVPTDASSTTVAQPAPAAGGAGIACPSIALPKCEFGNKIDTNGCPTAECNPAPEKLPMSVQQPSMEQLPQNCKRVMMEGGIERVICESQPAPCPVTYTDYDIQKCKAHNGNPNFFPDARGCKVFECRFQQQEQQAFMQPAQCPSEEERQRVSEKCKSSGMNAIVRKDFNGCLFVDCVREERLEARAACPPQEHIDRKAAECQKMGGKVFPEFDPNGCKIMRCEFGESRIFEVRGPEGQEPQPAEPACKPIPQEAFEKCGRDGGNLVVKKDERGCPTFAECIMRGNERQVKYEEVNEVPDSTTLVAMAFKLENLKIEFDKLAQRTEEIANYYAAAGKQADAERFSKVSSMFEGAENRVDEIKAKLRDKVNAPTIEDISGIKHDIAYIREVVMKDILYVMLGGEEGSMPSASGASAESVKLAKNSAGEIDCGKDDSCFNEQIRVCEKAVFYPGSGPKEKVEVHVAGLEDKKCVMKAAVADKSTGNIIAEMVCKLPDYVMGLKGPQDLPPYCEGSMVDYIRKANSGGQYPTQEPVRAAGIPEEAVPAVSTRSQPI